MSVLETIWETLRNNKIVLAKQKCYSNETKINNRVKKINFSY